MVSQSECGVRVLGGGVFCKKWGDVLAVKLSFVAVFRIRLLSVPMVDNL